MYCGKGADGKISRAIGFVRCSSSARNRLHCHTTVILMVSNSPPLTHLRHYSLKVLTQIQEKLKWFPKSINKRHHHNGYVFQRRNKCEAIMACLSSPWYLMHGVCTGTLPRTSCDRWPPWAGRLWPLKTPRRRGKAQKLATCFTNPLKTKNRGDT